MKYNANKKDLPAKAVQERHQFSKDTKEKALEGINE